MKRLVFLVYDARSGSTLLAALLDQFRGISVIPETNFLPRLVMNYSKKTPVDKQQLLEFLKLEPHFRELDINEDKLRAALAASKQSSAVAIALEGVLASYLERDNLTQDGVVVLKCGGALMCMPELALSFPEALFLHIVRDGRAVCASKIHSTSTWHRKIDKSIISSASHWSKRLSLADRFDGNYIEVRYEDLVSSKESVLGLIAEKLELDPSQKTVDTTTGSFAQKIGGRQKHLHKNIGTPSAVHIDKWRGQLNQYEIAYFESVCGALLSSRNYSLDMAKNSKVLNTYRYRCWVSWMKLQFLASRISNVFKRLMEGRLAELLQSKRYRSYDDN